MKTNKYNFEESFESNPYEEVVASLATGIERKTIESFIKKTAPISFSEKDFINICSIFSNYLSFLAYKKIKLEFMEKEITEESAQVYAESFPVKAKELAEAFNDFIVKYTGISLKKSDTPKE